MNEKWRYPIITGPTASGKTAKAVALARALNGEIISADSRQVFRGMDIGSGKDLTDYGEVAYHLIDIRPAGYKYNLYEFLRDEKSARENILSRGKQPIMCGGTGLYLESVVDGISLPEVPENPKLRKSLSGKSIDELTVILSGMKKMHNLTDVDTCQRAIRAIEIQQFYIDNPDAAKSAETPRRLDNAVVIGIEIDRDSRRERISRRLHMRLENGMIEEVDRLIKSGVDKEILINYGLEYKFITLYLMGLSTYDEMVARLEIAIHQFAKRQMTWFRGMAKRGIHINWLNYSLSDEEFVEKATKIIFNA